MDFSPLTSFIKKAAASGNPVVQQQANNLQGSLGSQQDEQIIDSDIQEHNQNNSQDQDELDSLLQEAMPELQLPDENDKTTFGKPGKPTNNSWTALKQSVQQKTGSAYIKDTVVKDLPDSTDKDIARFIGDNKSLKVILYGMVVSELLPKVDVHNFAQATKHVSEELDKKTIKQAKEDFFKKAKDKYILMMNDRVIDGNHFIATAKELGITNSLNVIDLTPVRFQKSASLLSEIKRKYATNNCR